ncbi:aldo/keto reductase [Flagelloscypha sp. PMI_526]|nr:aldo/keto reductase [Flagelloscypha sp. PMI_526]
MISKTTVMGGTTTTVQVAVISHGLMGMTWTPRSLSDTQCFESIKAGIDQLPPGVKMILNAGEFYATDLGPRNLELLARFFDANPSYADKVFLSVKGGTAPGTLTADSSPENLTRSIDAINGALRGTKTLDLFEPARLDGKNPVEDIAATLKTFVEQGKCSYVGLSECSAESLRRACKVVPIASAEIEVSLWSYEEETRKVIATAKELGVAIHAYSPIGRGLLTGTIQSLTDLPDGDMRSHFTRFADGNLEHNLKSVAQFKEIATKKGITPAQLAIAWVRSLGDHVIPLAGSSHKDRTLENLQAGEVELTAQELEDIQKVMNIQDIKGGRYNDNLTAAQLHLWG